VVHILIILDAVNPSTDLGYFSYSISLKFHKVITIEREIRDLRWFLCSLHKWVQSICVCVILIEKFNSIFLLCVFTL
jgi:hypothetical protein